MSNIFSPPPSGQYEIARALAAALRDGASEVIHHRPQQKCGTLLGDSTPVYRVWGIAYEVMVLDASIIAVYEAFDTQLRWGGPFVPQRQFVHVHITPPAAGRHTGDPCRVTIHVFDWHVYSALSEKIYEKTRLHRVPVEIVTMQPHSASPPHLPI